MMGKTLDGSVDVQLHGKDEEDDDVHDVLVGNDN